MHSEKSSFEFALGRSITGSICGIAVIVLAILGLAHIFPRALTSIATIVFGVSLLFKGAAISAEYSKLLMHLTGSSADKLELGGGMSAEIVTGIAGIVLGILALLHIAPATLVSIALIVFGAGLVMGSGVVSRLNALKLETSGTADASHHRVAEEMLSAAASAQILTGLAVIILGILSLIGLSPATLSLIALLVLGADSLLSGGAVSGRLLGMHHS